MLNQILYNKSEIPKIPIIATSSSFPSIGSESRSQCGHWKPPCMARESIRADNEFWNRKPAKIRRPAKLTVASGHTDNCQLRFTPGHNIQTEKSFISDRACCFVRSFAHDNGNNMLVRTRYLSRGKKKYPEYAACFERTQSSHSRCHVFVSMRPTHRDICTHNLSVRDVIYFVVFSYRSYRKNAASQCYFFRVICVRRRLSRSWSSLNYNRR